MVIHEDPLKSFIPKNEVKFIILGTMVAINGRIIDDSYPEDDFFYYNNNRNHFWRVMQYLMNSKLTSKEDIKKFSIKEKKDFLNEHGIAIINLVKKVEVPNKYKYDPSDTVLFEAYKKNRVDFKMIPPRVKKIIQSKPMFFTCRKKKGIDQLVDGFFQKNQLNNELKNNIWYLPTPTRCNPYNRSILWREEMTSFKDFSLN